MKSLNKLFLATILGFFAVSSDVLAMQDQDGQALSDRQAQCVDTDLPEALASLGVSSPANTTMVILPAPNAEIIAKWLEEECTDQFFATTAQLLNGLLTQVRPLQSIDPSYEEFRRDPQNISLDRWVTHLVRAGSLPKSVILHAFAYLKIIKDKYPDLIISKINIHRLFLVSTIIATKAMLDKAYRNGDWGKLTKIFTLNQINVMELEILKLLDYRLHLTDDAFNEVVARFMNS